MLHKQIVVLDNKEIATGYFLMELQSPSIAQNSSPGQFLHIKCSSNNNPILRRPISIHRIIDKKYIEILYRVVGKGTTCLSKRKKGEKIDCLGPLGNEFQLPINNYQSSINSVLLIAGGIGIAPLFFLTEKIAKLKIKSHPEKFKEFPGSSPRNLFKIPEGKSKITAFIGAKTKNDILCAKELKNLGAETYIATEDGSMGSKGLVSNLLKNKLATRYSLLATSIYACGPKEMLKEIALIAKKHEIPCQVSFEQFMGCGIGICNACVIKTKQGYKKVCKDGPVFNSAEIDWNKI